MEKLVSHTQPRFLLASAILSIFFIATKIFLVVHCLFFFWSQLLPAATASLSLPQAPICHHSVVPSYFAPSTLRTTILCQILPLKPAFCSSQAPLVQKLAYVKPGREMGKREQNKKVTEQVL